VELRGRVARQEGWTDDQKHYAYWLLQKSARMAQLAGGRAPEPGHFEVSPEERRQVRNTLRRVIRRRRGQRARVRRVRSFTLDANMYRAFEHEGNQYLAIMGLKGEKRTIIPLTGNRKIEGNLRIVLDFDQQRVEVHVTADVRPAAALPGEPCGLDAGVSEVYTDELGNQYGVELGQTLTRQSDDVCDKGRKRNKLHQIAKKAEKKSNHKKAARIRKFNLGTKKLRRKQRKMQKDVERQVNTALGDVLKTRRPSIIVTDKLDIRGRAPSKQLSRRVSQWARSILKDRSQFKASAGGSRLVDVNPAYTSQTCPACGYLDKRNRQGDVFQCLHCGHRDHADRVGAHNLKVRLGDPQITLWTPKERVKAVLLERFGTRLRREAEDGANHQASLPSTVSGRTPGTLA
jgi:putative transposase